MFTLFDKDRDGLLPISDLGSLLRSMGPTYNPSQKEIDDLRARFLPAGNIHVQIIDGLCGNPYKSHSFQVKHLEIN